MDRAEARVARSLLHTAQRRDFVDAARLAGVGPATAFRRHIWPQIGPAFAVRISLEMGSIVIAFSTLSFLGLGNQPPHSSWGLMLKSGVNNIIISPWLAVFPGLAIMLAVMAFNMVGDGLRDALDPKLQA